MDAIIETVGFRNPKLREERIKKTFQISDFAKELGVNVIAAHVGFIPEDRDDPVYKGMVEAVRKIADYCEKNGQYFALETGQETAEVLLQFIKDVGRDNIRVNFDPANMLFYGSGDPNELSKTLNIDRAVLDEIRSEFLYWYPVDVRGSGKDLIGNHLTFYIFHHVALFPADKWPRSITVNGYVMLNGRPMSKSAGNYISLENAIKAVGSDALRLSLLTLADGLEDPDWSLDKGYKALERLYSIEEFIKNVYSIDDDTQPTEVSYHDKLLLARYYTILDSIEKNISEHKIGQAGREIFYKLFDVFREYLKVAEKPNYILLKRLLRNYIKLLSLYAPFTAEELWHNALGEDSYISLETWPEVDRKYVNDIILLAHEYGSELRNDILHVYKLIPQPESKKKIIVMVASRWKWELIKDQINNKTFNISKFINDAVKMGVSNKAEAARVAGLIKKEWFGRYEKFRDLIKYWSQEDEINFIRTVFKDYIKYDIKDVELSIYDEENPPSETVFKKEPLPLYPAFVII